MNYKLIGYVCVPSHEHINNITILCCKNSDHLLMSTAQRIPCIHINAGV